MIVPPEWTSEQFENDLELAMSLFRRERLEEPLEAYLESFDQFQGIVEELLEATVDLSQVEDNALEILTDPRLVQAFRYLAGPPISTDDLKVLAEARSLNKASLQRDSEQVSRIVDVVMTCLDRRRFAWVVEKRNPSEAEKSAAVIASAALLATQRLGTNRRNEGKSAQEGKVEGALLATGFSKVATRTIRTLVDAPNLGEFCGECLCGPRKADFVVRLWDQRVMPIECKVSNSSTNSIKRLNNDAAVKAESWRKDFGVTQVVPIAVLGGVYKLRNLIDAQSRGLTIFWEHDLKQLTNWIQETKRK